MADWVTYYRTADGVCIGHGTVPPDTIPPGVATINHGVTRMDQVNRWDTVTRAWVPIPAEVLIDRLQDLIAHPYAAEIWTRLTVAQRTKLRKLMVWLLGGRRYRQQAEEIGIDVGSSWPTDPANAVE